MSKVYICDTCGKTFIGITNRRAKRPLDQKALAAANAKTETDCTRLDDPETGKQRAITLSSADYLCRRVWMDAYLDALEDEPDKTVPKQEEKPEDPIQSCPTVGPIDPRIKCVAVSIAAICEHKGGGVRFAADGEVLGVVPGSNYGTDMVTLEAKMQKPCGDHPIWSVTGAPDKQSTKTTLAASADVTSKLWIPSIRPKKYIATCVSHNCTRRVEIHAYPPSEISLNVDLKKGLQVVRTILDGLEQVLETVAGNFEWKYLEGKISVQANWKEHTDQRAFYAYAISVKLAPLFGAELKVPFGTKRITKFLSKVPGIGSYLQDAADWLVKAGVYFKLSGGINVDMAYKRDQPDQPEFVECLGAGLGGQLQAGIGGEGGLVGKLIKVELEVGGAVKAGGAPFINSTGAGLDKFEVAFDGLKGDCKLIFLLGIIDINETVTFIDARSIYGPKTLYFYKPD